MPPDKDEVEDAQRELERLGFDAGTFVFNRTNYPAHGTASAPVVADMTVENTENGKLKTYDAGHGSSWPLQFLKDLRAGFFGLPNVR
jgi:hypothetical protein